MSERAETGSSPALILGIGASVFTRSACTGQNFLASESLFAPPEGAQAHVPAASAVSDSLSGGRQRVRGETSPPFCFLHSFRWCTVTAVAGAVCLMPPGFVPQPALLILSGHILYLARCLSLKISLFFRAFFFLWHFNIHNRHIYKDIRGLKTNGCFTGRL